MRNQINPCRGEIWQVNFDPQVGREIRKPRPAVVMNVDSVGVLPLRIVVPITDWKASYLRRPWLVQLAPSSQNGLRKMSVADCFQMKSVDVQRFIRRKGVLVPTEIDEIAAAIVLCIGWLG